MSKEPNRPHKYIPVEEAVARWRKDPAYVKEYDALEEEFALVTAIIKARESGSMHQERARRRVTT